MDHSRSSVRIDSAMNATTSSTESLAKKEDKEKRTVESDVFGTHVSAVWLLRLERAGGRLHAALIARVASRYGIVRPMRSPSYPSLAQCYALHDVGKLSVATLQAMMRVKDEVSTLGSHPGHSST